MMGPVSGIRMGAAQPFAGVDEVKKVERPEEEIQPRSHRPVTDEYIPEKKPEPSGRYWPGRDEDGRPKICFDNPEQAENAAGEAADTPAQAKSAEGPEKSGEDGERCTCDTSKVDREIEKLRKKQQELEQRISRETDETKAEHWKRELAQVEKELRQKDTDAYRRQHAVYTFS